MEAIRILVLLCLTMACLAFAQEPLAGKSFQSWKDLQVLEAQNQVLRVSARISQIRAGKGANTNVKDLSNIPAGRVKTASDADGLSLAERDLKRARESLEAANALELEDYVNIYLPSLEAQPEALNALLQKLTKEELADILKVVLSKNSGLTAKPKVPSSAASAFPRPLPTDLVIEGWRRLCNS